MAGYIRRFPAYVPDDDEEFAKTLRETVREESFRRRRDVVRCIIGFLIGSLLGDILREIF